MTSTTGADELAHRVSEVVPDPRPGMVLTAAAGYVGPALTGLGAAAWVSRGHAPLTRWLRSSPTR